MAKTARKPQPKPQPQATPPLEEERIGELMRQVHTAHAWSSVMPQDRLDCFCLGARAAIEVLHVTGKLKD